MKILNTSGIKANKAFMLIYGRPDVGKTRWLATVKNPLVIDTENGLLSLNDKAVNFIQLNSFAAFSEVWPSLEQYIKKIDEDHPTLCVDSLTELADSCLRETLETQKDARKAYPVFFERIIKVIKALQSLPCHVVLTAKHETLDINGVQIHAPRMPWKKLQSELCHLFSTILYVFRGEDNHSYAIAKSSEFYEAKDRSGKLRDAKISLDKVTLQQVIDAITGVKA